MSIHRFVPFVFLIFTLLGCSSHKSERDLLSVAIETSPITLDPRVAADAFGDKIGKLIFNGLFKKNERLEVVPDLAETYEQPSPTIYRIFLRKNVFFHNGQPLTADDVVYTIRSILDGGIPSPYRAAFNRVTTVVAEDASTIRFELSEPYAPFLTALCRGIVPKDVAHENANTFGQSPIGTGPYRFVRSVSDVLVELAANPNYFSSPPKTPRLVIHIVKDDNIRLLKLLKGEVDLVMNAIPPLLLQEVEGKKNLVVKAEPGTVMSYIGMNLTDSVLREKRVRQALALGINRDEIIKHHRAGFAQKAVSILSSMNWAYDEGLTQLSYDPTQAKALLDEAGYPDPDGDGPKVRFTLSFKTSTVKERIDIVRMVAYQLAKIGVGIDVQSYEWGTFFRDVRSGNMQLYSLQWVGISEPDIFYDVFHSSQFPPDGMNRGRYKNVAVDQLVAEGRRTLDPQARKSIYAKVQKLLLDDLPMIPLWYENNVVVYRNTLKNVHLLPDASFNIFVDIEKT